MDIQILRIRKLNLRLRKTYEDISKYFFISLNTVRYHIKKIYEKLDSQNANQAVWNAQLLGFDKMIERIKGSMIDDPKIAL